MLVQRGLCLNPLGQNPSAPTSSGPNPCEQNQCQSFTQNKTRAVFGCFNLRRCVDSKNSRYISWSCDYRVPDGGWS